MTAFTAENAAHLTADERETMNAARARLLAERVDEDTSDEDRFQIEHTVSDQLANAWSEGVSADDLVARVRGGHA